MHDDIFLIRVNPRPSAAQNILVVFSESVTVVQICHMSVSVCHSASGFGDEDSIDKNSPKISKTAMIAPASIKDSRFSSRLNSN